MPTPKIQAKPGEPEFAVEVVRHMTEEGQSQFDLDFETQRLVSLAVAGDTDAISAVFDLVNVGLHYAKGYLA